MPIDSAPFVMESMLSFSISHAITSSGWILTSAASSRDRAPAFVSRDYLRENLLERLNANARRLVRDVLPELAPQIRVRVRDVLHIRIPPCRVGVAALHACGCGKCAAPAKRHRRGHAAHELLSRNLFHALPFSFPLVICHARFTTRPETAASRCMSLSGSSCISIPEVF